MRTIPMIAAIAALALLSTTAIAGEAKVSFEKVEDYTDFEPASGIEERFQKRQMDELTAYFNELSQQLPKDQVLNVTVTDIDLTGRLEPTFGEGGSNFIRVVRSIDFPVLHFNYQLHGADGAVIKEDQVKLKDMSFDFGSMATKRSQNDDLYYEKKMLKSWFDETFSEHLKTNQPGESA